MEHEDIGTRWDVYGLFPEDRDAWLALRPTYVLAACERARDEVRRRVGREWPYGKTVEWTGDGRGNVLAVLVDGTGVRR